MADRLHRHTERGTSYLAGGEGPPVVFLHGIPGSALTWAPVATRVLERGRVIAPDLRGFGQSAPPVADYYMHGQARAVADLLAALGAAECTLVAHDFGGPVALTLLRLFPELTVRELVLASTNLFTDTDVPLPLRIARVPVVSTAFFRLAVGNRLGLRLLYEGAVERKETVPWSSFRRHLTPSGIAMTRKIFQRSLADLEANYSAVERMLPDVQARTLVLWGDSDPFFSTSVAERTRAAFAGGDLIVFEDTGHFVPEERPDEVASALLEVIRS